MVKYIHLYSNNICDGFGNYDNLPVIPFTDRLGTCLIQPQLVHLTICQRMRKFKF